MNRRSLVFVLSVLLTSIGSSQGTCAQTHDTIQLTSGNWQPMMSENGPHHGFVSHIITEAFALRGVEVEYIYFSWAEAIGLAKEGEYVGSAAWWDRPERHIDFLFSDPIAPSKVVFFFSNGLDFDWSAFEDLAGLTVGATEGYNYGKEFNEAKRKGIINVEIAPSDEINLNKLLEEKIDVFPGDLMVTHAQIRDTFTAEEAEQFTYNPKPVFEEPLFLILSKKIPDNERLLKRFNEGLAMLKESGRYDKIIADGVAGEYDTTWR